MQERHAETVARLFTNGRSQAVRIPKAFQFEGVSEVVIRKEGDALIMVPARKTWTPTRKTHRPWATTI